MPRSSPASLARRSMRSPGRITSGARLAAALRRIERQASLCSRILLTPVAEALERVLTETDTARAKIEEAHRAQRLRAERPRARRGAAVRPARAPPASTGWAVDDLPLAASVGFEAELAALDTSEARGRGAGQARGGGAPGLRGSSRRPEQGEAAGSQAPGRRSHGRAQPAQAGKSGLHHSI